MKRNSRLVILPTLVTLGNLACGFLAINYVGDYVRDVTAAGLVKDAALRAEYLASGADRLSLAAWLIFLGMVFDALDGYVARLTRQQSDFGLELDSICDVVTFGIAPAFLAKSLIAIELTAINMSATHDLARERFAWAFATIYAVCAASRLARFNVDTEEEDSHTEFHGLPSPAAAAVLAGLAILYVTLWKNGIVESRAGAAWVLHLERIMLLACGLAMVSRIRYSHFVNHFLAQRMKPRRLALIAAPVLLAMLLAPEFLMAIAAMAYFLSGPIGSLRRWGRKGRIPDPEADSVADPAADPVADPADELV